MLWGHRTTTSRSWGILVPSVFRQADTRRLFQQTPRVAGAHLRLDRLGNAIFQHRHRTLHIRFGSLYVIRRGRGHVRVSQNPAYGPSAWEVAPRLLAEFRGHQRFTPKPTNSDLPKTTLGELLRHDLAGI